MGLLDVVAADLRRILGDTSLFALPITITDPDGQTVVVNGQQRDISLSIDPGTGVQVAGRTASVALSYGALIEAFDELPVGVAEEGGKPWLVAFTAPTGGPQLLEVTQCVPDTLGCVVLTLGAYEM